MNLLENKTILIIGLGLIGGSVARGLSAAIPSVRILAHGRDELALQSALLDGSVHAYSTDLSTLAPQSDLIMLCVPTLTVRPVLEQLKIFVGPEVIITDVASVKGNIVNDARRLFSDSLHRFVPGHPIAGSEQSGYNASRPDLFFNRKVILTPLAENSTLAVRAVMQLWQALGADVHGMTPSRHDEVLAGTSHLPHLLAYTLVNTLVDCVSQQDRAQQVFDYAAGGFADFSRIASSDPYMWRDIFLANRDATVDVLDAFMGSLDEMRQRLLRGDGDGLQAEFTRAKRVRDEFIRRFRPSGFTSEERISSGFTHAADCISIFPGSSLIGSFRPPANLSDTLTALQKCVSVAGVTRIEGCPDNVAVLAAAQDLRASGVPIVGPERGTAWVYGMSESAELVPNTDKSSIVELAADPFLTGLIALGAAILPGSLVHLQSVLDSQEPGTMLNCLRKFGARLGFVETSNDLVEIVCESSDLFGVTLDLSQTTLSDEQLLVIFATAALAVGESNILLPVERALGLINTHVELFNWAFDITLGDDIVTIRPKPLQPAELDFSYNVAASLTAIIMAQKVSGQLLVSQPGDIAESYPGVLQILISMGFGLNYVAT